LFGHKDSFENLLGSDDLNNLKEKMSLENQVHKEFPPVFIWHTMEGNTVPVENSLFFCVSSKKIQNTF